MVLETVYVSYGNTIDLKFLSDGSAVELSGVTSMVALIGGGHSYVSLYSVNSSADIMIWGQASMATGEMRAKFGTVSTVHFNLPARSVRDLDAWFVAYDSTNSNGIVYGPITITFKRLPQQ